MPPGAPAALLPHSPRGLFPSFYFDVELGSHSPSLLTALRSHARALPGTSPLTSPKGLCPACTPASPPVSCAHGDLRLTPPQGQEFPLLSLPQGPHSGNPLSPESCCPFLPALTTAGQPVSQNAAGTALHPPPSAPCAQGTGRPLCMPTSL